MLVRLGEVPGVKTKLQAHNSMPKLIIETSIFMEEKKINWESMGTDFVNFN